jgi:hypothetical protein
MKTPAPFRLEQRPFAKAHSPLLAHARNVTSQTGEDGILERIFKIIPEAGGYFVEFGAWDGRHLSNCWNLAANHGWAGCFIEAEAVRFEALLANHGSNPRIACVNAFVEAEGPGSLDGILASVGAPEEFALISIDVDGMDYFIWDGMQNYRPGVVVIEFNPTVPNDVLFVQARDATVNQGCSLLALVELARIKGYQLVCCTAFNAFFVREELFARFGIADNSVWRLYQPLMDGRIFQGYDSYIHVVGMPGLMWAKRALSDEDFQVLAPAGREFDDGRRK